MTKKKAKVDVDVDCPEKNCPKRKNTKSVCSQEPKRLGLLGRVLKYLFPSRYQ